MSIIEWLLNVFGIPYNGTETWLIYVISGCVLLILLDAIISLFFGAFSSLTRGGRK